MASFEFSKSSTTSGGGYLRGKITYTATQSASDNTSTITFTVQVKKGHDSMTLTESTIGNFSYSLDIDGAIYNGSNNLEILTSYKTIGAFSVKVPHNNDGTKTIKITGYVTLSSNSSSSYYGLKSWISDSNKSITLTSIPRASTITSAGNVTLGNKCSIQWTPASTSFKYKIKFSYGNWNYTTDYITPGVTSAYTYSGYTISGDTVANNTTLYAQLPSATSGTMTATLTTYNSSGTAIGSSSSKTFTISIPNTIVPSIGTITIDPANITTSDGTSRDILVQNNNKITFSTTGAAAGAGSSIKSYKFEVLSGSTVIATQTTTSASFQFGPFSQTGTLKFRLTVTDNRNRTASNNGSEKTCTCNAYTTPNFSSFTAYRCNSGGTKDNNGTYIKYDLAINYATVSSTNKCNVKIYYKTTASTSWTTASNALTDSTATTASAIIKNTSGTNISNFDVNSSYMVYATVTDNYGKSLNSSTITIFGASRIFNVRSDGTGVAFGKISESSDALESKWIIKPLNGIAETSDRRLKTNIVNMSELQEQLFNKLQPVTFNFINGSSGRTHYGFVAQDVEKSLCELNLTPKDFAGFCKDQHMDYNEEPVIDENGNEIYDYSLRYSEFIALNTYMIQKLQAENMELKKELQELKEIIVGTSSKNIE